MAKNLRDYEEMVRVGLSLPKSDFDGVPQEDREHLPISQIIRKYFRLGVDTSVKSTTRGNSA